ncbi:myelin proteolipid protein-like isoform X4 [Biomphalaria glabrata]|uniref:Myelin proteolipid protein-like isoform X4 n=1 Tax=Biomphalaria glabrata TaxID=6526 RepID=A0A9W3B360_BIOGL|nr:myelin proteolipid protein-like isoform X4 [Biomphalaria glabrata]
MSGVFRQSSGDNCCSSFLKCLGLVPCPSLLSWIILLCGIGCLTGSLLIGTWRTRELLKGDEDLLWFMEYTIIGVTIGMFVIGTLLLTTGHLSTEPTSRRIFNSLTKNRCAQGLNICALVVAYILTIIWILVSVVLATPLVLLINIICIVNPESIDPSLYGFKSGQITRTQFHEDGVNLLITYAIALFGSILIVNSLICFLISISANITHLRDNRFATFNTYSPGEEIHCSKHSVVDTNM